MNIRSKAIQATFIPLLVYVTNTVAQQPPDVVVSDRFGNTAAGTDALKSLQTTGPGAAEENTAVGIFALQGNISGGANTSIGARTISGLERTPERR